MIHQIFIEKNPSAYTERHNKFMDTVIHNYPGITIVSEDEIMIVVAPTTEDAIAFLRHMVDCNMLYAYFDLAYEDDD